MFINKSINNKFTTCPYFNGLSDHDAQVLILNNIKVLSPQKNIYTIRIINDDTLSTFKSELFYEVWEEVIADNDVDTIFNNFLTTCLRIFHHCFPLKKFIKANKKRLDNKGHKNILYPQKRPVST
jgi:hypothetical protein